MTNGPDLQFDRAEFDQPATTCVLCSEPLRDRYFEVNGQITCPGCCERLRGPAEHGTRTSRVVRAVGAGVGAAILGSLLYWVILAVSGYEFGLIAVIVGIGVGKAVAWGSRGKGGWRYQALAMVLTYLAMVTAYAPMVFAELAKTASETPAGAGTSSQPSAETPPATSEVTDEPVTVFGAVVAFAVLLAFLCTLPFLAGIENILGILILGFGLFEAWKLNRRVQVVVTGPHEITVPQSV